ncbi:MAG: helix-turn-helix transcriptional regulator [Halopseudomonas sp.]
MDIELLQKQTDWCDMQFHEHLKTLRQAKGLTQTQAADEIEIAKNTYVGYENGSREPRLSELKKLSSLFGMTLSELCMETDSRSVDDELVLRFQAVRQFSADELTAFNTLVEAMVIRHHANKARSL